MFFRSSLQIVLCLLAVTLSAQAAGPRWVTGPPYYSTQGIAIVWYTNQPLYFTDPGDLSPSVNHAAADAIVAAAANVWNVSTSSLVLASGGTLAEHVSGANVYATTTGLVFPADVQSANYQSIQIAVVYDSDGSVTDLMLGGGASNPSGCRQNAVTESVDSITTGGNIQHAILVLNGRCTGPDPQQQLQLQYQLVRAFGRILGLGWSQTNDNVFTNSPAPTYNQALNWPIMHPIDVICGLYTYQCMPQPFTLRPDDISSLVYLYPVTPSNPAPGKEHTLFNSNDIRGTVTFPNGQGMQGVNVVVQRLRAFGGIPEPWQSASSVSGFLFRRDADNPVDGSIAPAVTNMGSFDATREGYYEMASVPILAPQYDWQNAVITTEPINPLYTGQYAVDPYDAGAVEPSGTTPVGQAWLMTPYTVAEINLPATISTTDSAPPDSSTASSPVSTDPQGWWTACLCDYGRTAWFTLAVQANRTLTFEVTAQDEQGYTTAAKMMPVVGVWNVNDATGSLPTIAAAGTAFNSTAIGMTTLTAQSTQPQQLRIAIADQRGDGRPDYAFQGRVLYADNIAPANVPATGGTVTITGMGFRAGNAVTVNGVAATVTSWSSTSIVAVVPSLSALHSTTALSADILVKDLTTGGATEMNSALAYAAPVPSLNLISAPTSTVALSQVATVPFTVQALQGDGVTPIAGQQVIFAATSNTVQFNVCGAATCTLLTDASGYATTTITPLAAGIIVVTATSSIGTKTASFSAAALVRSLVTTPSIEYIAAGVNVALNPQANLTDNIFPVASVLVNWIPIAGPIAFTPNTSTTDAQGVATTQALAGPLAPGTQATASACAWTSVCTSLAVQGVDPSQWRLAIVGGAGQSISSTGTLAPIVLQVTDSGAHPIAGALVEIHQTVDAWQPPCPDRGRCPIAPVYGSANTTATSDTNGMLTITPLELPGVATTTNIAVATGTQSFVSLTLQKHP